MDYLRQERVKKIMAKTAKRRRLRGRPIRGHSSRVMSRAVDTSAPPAPARRGSLYLFRPQHGSGAITLTQYGVELKSESASNTFFVLCFKLTGAVETRSFVND
ncbi:hypothetical protein EVAR_2775_1 [Eumeta japonica]|uniref:Uncharacterized protein n=1 Tax=Eumeta variegata TaxID=151549 RepID=A0A4C1T0G0_EUMVA|nr:hypothetical protein EVAR_2775_1 [Eumeta japonica]